MRFIRKNGLLLSFWLIGLLAFFMRLFLNFSQDLLIGNGGYYPLQVRSVLEKGSLAFPDMPLLFYLDAGIVRLLTFLGVSPSNEVILIVVKLVDSLSIPLLLFPLYHILRRSKKNQFSIYFLSGSAFTVLSFYTLNLTSSFQKNALAITFLFFAIAWFFKYLHSSSVKQFIVALTFLALTGLTHFGTFSFALISGILFLSFRYKKKAIVPIIALMIAALLLIYQFDSTRFSRLLFVWKGVFSSFPPPNQLVLAVIYLTIAILAIRVYKKYKDRFSSIEKATIFTLITLLIILPSPILEPQTSSRMSAFLFIPIVLLLFQFDAQITPKSKKGITALLGLITLGSICFFAMFRPPTDVNPNELKDLQKMRSSVTFPERSVVVARHNLEFWVAWALEVDVSQEHKFNDTLIREYDAIFIIHQIHKPASDPPTPNTDGELKRSPFDAPLIPDNAVLVYSSEYFKLYQYKKSPLTQLSTLNPRVN